MRRRLTLIVWLVGMLAMFALVLHQGIASVAQGVVASGWWLLLITLFHLVPMAADTLAWHHLLPAASRPTMPRLLWIRWIGESVNSLLPAGQIGGDLLRGRLAAQRGVPPAEAAGSIVVDLTLSVLTLALSSILGVSLAIKRSEQSLVPLLVVLVLAVLGCCAVLVLQHRGLFHGMTRLLGRIVNHELWDRIAGGAFALDAAIVAIYSRPRLIAACVFWQVMAWGLGAGEIWLALASLDHPIGVLDSIMIECLIQAVRGAAFPVPGAVGVQEGSMMLLGLLVGVPADTALAVSLIRRIRELLLGIPGLGAWQLTEGRRWFGQRA